MRFSCMSPEQISGKHIMFHFLFLQRQALGLESETTLLKIFIYVASISRRVILRVEEMRRFEGGDWARVSRQLTRATWMKHTPATHLPLQWRNTARAPPPSSHSGRWLAACLPLGHLVRWLARGNVGDQSASTLTFGTGNFCRTRKRNEKKKEK